MKQTTIQQRDYLFDNAKAFLIFTVVVGHLQGDLSKSGVFPGGNPLWLNSLWQFIFVFHMPVFMAISGYFSKKRVQNNDWISVIDKLVIPYISFQLSLFLMQMVFDYGSTSSFSLLEPRFGSWYIATIAAYQIITPHLLKKKHLFICSLIIALAVPFALRGYYGGFQRLFTYYPFFLFGYYLSERNIDLSRWKKPAYRILSVCALVAIGVLVTRYSSYIHPKMLSMEKTFIEIRNALKFGRLGFLVLMILRYLLGFLCFFFILGISSTKKRFFTYIGTYSTYVYFLHIFIDVIMRALDARYGILSILGNTTGALIYLSASIPLCFILASPFVRKNTRFLVAPDFHIKKIAKKLFE